MVQQKLCHPSIKNTSVRSKRMYKYKSKNNCLLTSKRFKQNIWYDERKNKYFKEITTFSAKMSNVENLPSVMRCSEIASQIG